MKSKKVRLRGVLFGGVLTFMSGTAIGMTIAGADPQATLLVAGGHGLVAGEVAVRLVRSDDEGPDDAGGSGGSGRLAIA